MHTIFCYAKDHAGVLVNIAASFAQNGINITTLDFAEPYEGKSRVTIVVKCEESILHEVMGHLKAVSDVLSVDEIDHSNLNERRVMLVKVKAVGENIARIMGYVEVFRATIAGVGKESLTIEMAGPESKVNALTSLLKPFGILEMARSGRVAIHADELTG